MKAEDFILDRTAPEAEVWVTKQGAGQTEDGEKPADDGSSEDGRTIVGWRAVSS